MTLEATGRCRSAACLRPILFAMVRKLDGKITKLPVDPDPVPDGNLAYVSGESRRPVLRTLDEVERLQRSDEPRYQAHFRSCPAAESFRRSSPAPEMRSALATARTPAARDRRGRSRRKAGR